MNLNTKSLPQGQQIQAGLYLCLYVESTSKVLMVHFKLLPQLLELLESPPWVGVHQVGFLMFWHMVVEKLLNIEYFFIEYLFN
jgi:hypothetical protein